jgi:ABC-type transport system involved in Fe-S cluster assembly fused permease/ATPase subunit
VSFTLLPSERVRRVRRELIQGSNGIRGISFLLSSVVFHVVPTALEITMVCGILVSCPLTLSEPQVK